VSREGQGKGKQIITNNQRKVLYLKGVVLDEAKTWPLSFTATIQKKGGEKRKGCLNQSAGRGELVPLSRKKRGNSGKGWLVIIVGTIGQPQTWGSERDQDRLRVPQRRGKGEEKTLKKIGVCRPRPKVRLLCRPERTGTKWSDMELWGEGAVRTEGMEALQKTAGTEYGPGAAWPEEQEGGGAHTPFFSRNGKKKSERQDFSASR